jgi:hypothetical protein
LAFEEARMKELDFSTGKVLASPLRMNHEEAEIKQEKLKVMLIDLLPECC